MVSPSEVAEALARFRAGTDRLGDTGIIIRAYEAAAAEAGGLRAQLERALSLGETACDLAEQVAAEAERLKAEVRRLSDRAGPHSSQSQQARAWVAVWRALGEAGLNDRPARNGITAQEQAVEFIGELAKRPVSDSLAGVMRCPFIR